MDNQEVQPTADVVYQYIYTLNHSTDPTEQVKASKWLENFQKTVYSWKICDELLQEHRDIPSCYFAAQTMRNKIQTSFHELPTTSHESLRDALLNHILMLNHEDRRVTIQLALAIADLALLMPSWKNFVVNLMQKFCPNNTLDRQMDAWPLLTVYRVIPEEINSRFLRLGANRRTDIVKELKSNSKPVTEFLIACLKCDIKEFHVELVNCYTSWLSVHAIALNETKDSPIVAFCFNVLRDVETTIKLHDAATNCLCCLIQNLVIDKDASMLEKQLFESILSLEDAYHMSVAHEDVDNAMNFCRIFTTLAETFLERMVHHSTDDEPHYSIKVLNLLLNCVGHYDYEIGEITFNFWYKLSEQVYNRNSINLKNHFQPYIERLIMALFRLSQMDSDQEGIIPEGDVFYDFRKKVAEVIIDVVFIIGSSNVFKTMFMTLQDPGVTWERSEAALFVMEMVARNILTDENVYVPKVIEAILNLPENTHIAVRYTSILLLGELCEWIECNSDYLESILNFLLVGLQQKNDIAQAAAQALQQICSHCKIHMTRHIDGLIQIVGCLDSFEIKNEYAIGLLKGVSIIIGNISNDQITRVLREICAFQLTPLCQLIESEVKIDRGSRSDPVFWLDRLAAIFHHTQPTVGENEVHPSAIVVADIWPVISNVMDKYQNNSRIMERTCRLLRYAVRGIGQQSAHILEALVKQMVMLYAMYQHSCFLYLGSILVDEFGKNPQCTQGLLEMLQAFIEPTFNILQLENGLKNHPDTVDDFFRLCVRFIQRCPFEFLQSPAVTPILQCGILACALDHREANMSVMRFFTSLLSYGRPDNNLCEVLQQIVQINGETLVMNLIHASVFCLHSYMLTDVADVLVELKAINSENMRNYLKSALDALPKKNSGGYVTATELQLQEFHDNIMRSESAKAMSYILRDFARLYR